MEYQFTENWMNFNIPSWSKIFTEILPNPKRLLEIGSYEGCSAVWLLNNAMKEDSILYCIDTWEDASVEARFDHNCADKRIVKSKNRSSNELRILNLNDWDFIYIDGSHVACDVLEDLVLSWRLCKIGGVIICDDFLWGMDKNPRDTPKLAIDAFLNCYGNKLQMIYTIINQVCFIKRAE